MLMMNGLQGLSGPESCGSNQKWDPYATYPGAVQAGFCVPLDAPLTPHEEQPWWSTLVRSVATGAAAGITAPHQTALPPPPPPAPTPWYTTPMGMAGIIGGALVLFLVMKK